ncbi:hypothetical protein KC959_01600 [Candidatus Saccharibacteria bacterium]|nr:hypothetical protein [Candidatus Saccharibacteria bacterium]
MANLFKAFALLFLRYVVQMNAPGFLSGLMAVVAIAIVSLSVLSYLNIFDIISAATTGQPVSHPVATTFIMLSLCYLIGAVMGEMAADPTFREYILSWVIPK